MVSFVCLVCKGNIRQCGKCKQIKKQKSDTRNYMTRTCHRCQKRISAPSSLYFMNDDVFCSRRCRKSNFDDGSETRPKKLRKTERDCIDAVAEQELDSIQWPLYDGVLVQRHASSLLRYHGELQSYLRNDEAFVAHAKTVGKPAFQVRKTIQAIYECIDAVIGELLRCYRTPNRNFVQQCLCTGDYGASLLRVCAFVVYKVFRPRSE